MAIRGIQHPAIPYGSLVVVSGVSGFIGSHVADQVLAADFKVRGTTRSIAKSSWIKEQFQKKYGASSFELVEVPDMAADDAFEAAVKGAAGFIHVASDMTHSNDPNVAIPRTVNGALNALKSSAKESSMKRFVYTSSSFAATMPKPGSRFTVTAGTFNDEALERTWSSHADSETVYAAGKVEAEGAISQWVKEHRSSLIVNAILPNANIGPLISSFNQGYPTSAGWVKKLWDPDYESLHGTPAQHFINVQDDAKLHVIALALPEIKDERIFAMAGPVNLNDIINILRKLYPQTEWKDFSDDRRDMSVIEPMQWAEKLLKDAYGHDFTSLEESVKANAADLAV